MHAIRLHEFGPPGNLRLEEVDDPVAGEGQVRIVVEAAGVHLIEASIHSPVAWNVYSVPASSQIPVSFHFWAA